MKKKLFTLAAVAGLLLTACGTDTSAGTPATTTTSGGASSGGTTTESGEYQLDVLNITVDGTLTATDQAQHHAA